MNLALNIGNTHTRIAFCSGNAIQRIKTIATGDLTSELLTGAEQIAAACVVPQIRRRLTGVKKIFWLDWQHCADLRFHNVDPTTVGADRIANALTLRDFCGAPAMVFDFGTAVTAEAVNADGEFIGGIIAPGRMLMRRALHNYTGQLPIVDLAGDIPSTGNNTVAAMRLGIDGGAVGLVKELICRLRENAEFSGSEKNIFAVGGDRDFFMRQLPELRDGGEDFTLRGVIYAAEW